MTSQSEKSKPSKWNMSFKNGIAVFGGFCYVSDFLYSVGVHPMNFLKTLL